MSSREEILLEHVAREGQALFGGRMAVWRDGRRVLARAVRTTRPDWEEDARRACFEWRDRAHFVMVDPPPRIVSDWLDTFPHAAFAWGRDGMHTVHAVDSERDLVDRFVPRAREYLLCMFRDVYIQLRLEERGARVESGGVVTRDGALLFTICGLCDAPWFVITLAHAGPAFGAFGDRLAAWAARVRQLGGTACALSPGDGKQLRVPADTPARIVATAELLIHIARSCSR